MTVTLTHIRRGSQRGAWDRKLMARLFQQGVCSQCGARPVRYFVMPSNRGNRAEYDVTFLCEGCRR